MKDIPGCKMADIIAPCIALVGSSASPLVFLEH